MNTSKALLFIAALMALLAASLQASPALAQGNAELVKIQQQLLKVMARQEPLTAGDIKTYLANAEAIYRLRYEPEKLQEVSEGISAWDDDRFAYVTTKVAVGMSLLMKPDDARNRSLPAFARPTQAELDLIKRHLDELTRAMDAIRAKY